MSKTAFANDILYIKNLKKHHEKNVKIHHEFNKVAWYKINLQKSVFLNTVKKNYQGN